MIKRLLVTVIGIPILIAVLASGNKYFIDILVALFAVRGIYEYFKCSKQKFKPVSWIGYILAISLVFIHMVPIEIVTKYLGIAILSIFALLFLHVIITDMKINVIDIAVSLFGYIYVIGFFAFVSLVYGYERDGIFLGKYYIWFLFLATWGSDMFAYLIGCKFGKHKFSKISPNKSIEGCVAGLFAGVALSMAMTVLLNICFALQINYLVMAGISIVLTAMGQIGDFAASAIKRYLGVKDFSNLLPGHGGLIDRFDSVIFTAPFAYYLITLFL